MYKKNKGIEVGDWVVLKKQHSSFSGEFTKGSIVRVVAVTERGYDIEDENGNQMCECGWEL